MRRIGLLYFQPAWEEESANICGLQATPARIRLLIELIIVTPHIFSSINLWISNHLVTDFFIETTNPESQRHL